MRRALLWVTLAVGACSGCRSGAVFYVAQGVRDRLPDYAGRCPRDTLTGDALRFVAEGDSYVAERAGESSLRCEDGTLTLRVRPLVRLRLDAPAEAPPGTRLIVRVVGEDAEGRALRLGDAPVWSVDGGDTLDRCNHMLGSCLSADAVRVRTAERGPTTLRVEVGEQRLEQQIAPSR